MNLKVFAVPLDGENYSKIKSWNLCGVIISFPTAYGAMVCRVSVRPSPHKHNKMINVSESGLTPSLFVSQTAVYNTWSTRIQTCCEMYHCRVQILSYRSSAPWRLCMHSKEGCSYIKRIIIESQRGRYKLTCLWFLHQLYHCRVSFIFRVVITSKINLNSRSKILFTKTTALLG